MAELQWLYEQKWKYDELGSWLREKRAEIQIRMAKTKNAPYASVPDAVDDLIGIPWDTFAEYAGITTKNIDQVLSEFSQAQSYIDRAITEAAEVSARYQRRIEAELARLRERRKRG